METYKTLKQMEKESHSMPLDHVMSHPFFAKKSSLQEKNKMAISKPKEGDGHDHSSETMNQYKGEHEKNGMDVTKSRPKKRPSESGNLEQQKMAHASADIDELELDEGIKHDRYMRSHGKKANPKERATWVFTTDKMGHPDIDDKKKVYMATRPMTLAQAGKEAMKALKSKEVYVMESHLMGGSDEYKLDEACGCEDVDSKRVDGRTKAYRETYTRIMNRLGKLREKAKKNNMEQYGEEN